MDSLHLLQSTNSSEKRLGRKLDFSKAECGRLPVGGFPLQIFENIERVEVSPFLSPLKGSFEEIRER